MNNTICPYPGLRPFTEEESIFFKGRDLHIRQIVKMLERNKMAFITGASGDGKSSMVYAGVVPYIRAGFSKAEFNSWIVCDFKPQRNPLESLVKNLSEQLQVPYDDTLVKLRRGFKALVKTYKESGFYVKDGKNAANRGKNLLIIADQFEEIFTMNENFNNGTPSNDAYTTVNLLLETIRISIAEQLPVYVIFTMRSDYISQCTVFKDLPEFIAFSQFFVPQLKRSEILQVIEQPAVMAGGSVSSRLSEVLSNNLNSGFDQLPVLQHALNLLWKTANNGSETLDLIHLAKIAGISKDLLSDSERQEFNRWFALLPDYQKKYYEKPDLNNVLNAHAGTLYESAFDYYMQNADWADKTITPDESKQIIETAFKTLTKIDDNRLVRSRCTLNEITGIINKPHITDATVCAVLNIFRSDDNTLLQPFIVKEDINTQYLSGDTTLDVTHEALIRNWKMLADWDREELENLKEYNDFSAQMQRWLDNGRSPEFLLGAGNYAIFSNWYDRCKPNLYWILKNDNSQRPYNERHHSAATRMEKCDAYMQESRDALQEQEKSRRRKIAIAIAALLVFIAGLSIFALWARNEQKEADRQRQEADLQKDNAINAEKEAQKQRDSVKILLRDTQKAKDESDSALTVAENARRAAVAARRDADSARNEAQKALFQAQLAQKNAEYNERIAKAQSDTAQRERQNAVKANDLALQRYYEALCNALAMKAKNQYEDKTLNLRLVKAAWEMNQKAGGSPKNADLYDAMLFALEQNKIVKPSQLGDELEKKTFSIDNTGRIIIMLDDGTILKYKIADNGNLALILPFGRDFESKVPLEVIKFVTPTLIAYSTKDRKSYLADLQTKNMYPIAENGYIKAASLSPDGNLCAIAYNTGEVIIMPLSGNTPVSRCTFDGKPSDVYFHNNDNVYVLSHDGSLTKWNHKSNDKKTILPPAKGENAFKMAAIPDKDLLAICYSGGDIQFINLKNDTKGDKRTVAHSKLDNIAYDPNTGILAVASADKRISLINTNDFNEKPLVIEEHSLDNKRVIALAFNNKGVLFALTDGGVLFHWDTNPATYATALSTMNIAPLSQSEWDLIMGRDFSEQ